LYEDSGEVERSFRREAVYSSSFCENGKVSYDSRVAEVFDRGAASYDRLRRQLIPCFDDFYGTVPGLLPFAPDAPIRVLDLGAGTGILSGYIAQAFSNVRLTLMDVAGAMLDQARRRAGLASAEFVLGDYAAADLTGGWDAVVSALSIHHLDDDAKRRLYGRIRTALRPGGVFINADQVCGSTPYLVEQYRQQWLRDVKTKKVAPEDLAAAVERTELDRMAPLVPQLEWLAGAGFVDVDCWYKNWSFIVFGGRRAEQDS